MNDSDSEEDEEVEEEKEKVKSYSNKRIGSMKANKIVKKYNKRKQAQNQKVTCTFPGCGLVLMNKRNFRYHMDIHSDETFLCKHKGCKRVFNTRGTLGYHLSNKKSHRKENYKVGCKYPGCDSVLSNKVNLKHHMKVHSDETFVCDHIGCGLDFQTSSGLRKHKIKHLGKFRCDFDTCDFIGESINKVNLHKLSHTDNRPVKCEHCDKCFKDKYGLNGHMKTLHPEECRDLPLLVCEVKGCQYQTKSTQSFNAHKRSHILPFECDICHKKFSRKYTFEDHKHRHSEDKPFKCKHCSKGFPTKRSLRRHTESLHKPKTILCDVKGCGKYFANTYDLETHEKTHKDKPKNYLCEWPGCDQKFTTKGNIERHMNRHKRNLSFPCVWPGCDKSFFTKQQLDSHNNSHTGNRPYRCKWPDCDKAFTSCNALCVHTKRHEGYTYSCRFDDCDFKCYNYVRLKQHYRNHHDNFVE